LTATPGEATRAARKEILFQPGRVFAQDAFVAVVEKHVVQRWRVRRDVSPPGRIECQQRLQLFQGPGLITAQRHFATLAVQAQDQAVQCVGVDHQHPAHCAQKKRRRNNAFRRWCKCIMVAFYRLARLGDASCRHVSAARPGLSRKPWIKQLNALQCGEGFLAGIKFAFHNTIESFYFVGRHPRCRRPVRDQRRHPCPPNTPA
jgi:hypothetical protein